MPSWHRFAMKLYRASVVGQIRRQLVMGLTCEMHSADCGFNPR